MADLPTLFDATPVVLAEVLQQTTGERRRARQAEAIAHGQHPLAVALRISLPLLRSTPTRTCGECSLRGLVGGRARDFPKCWWSREAGKHPRITAGPGTDVRKHWPACIDFSPKEAK